MPQRIRTLPGVNQCWTQRPTLHSAVLLYQVLQVSEKYYVSVGLTLWLCLQRCCKTFCFVCFDQPALSRQCVLVLWTSCLMAKSK